MYWQYITVDKSEISNLLFGCLIFQEECQLRTQEEETKRKELSDKFQTTINDISDQMQDNFKRNQELKEENAQ